MQYSSENTCFEMPDVYVRLCVMRSLAETMSLPQHENERDREREYNAARRAAAFADAGGFGQPYGAQESGVALMDVRQRGDGALYPSGSLLAEHDRVDAADTQAASVGGALSGE